MQKPKVDDNKKKKKEETDEKPPEIPDFVVEMVKKGSIKEYYSWREEEEEKNQRKTDDKKKKRPKLKCWRYDKDFMILKKGNRTKMQRIDAPRMVTEKWAMIDAGIEPKDGFGSIEDITEYVFGSEFEEIYEKEQKERIEKEKKNSVKKEEPKIQKKSKESKKPSQNQKPSKEEKKKFLTPSKPSKGLKEPKKSKESGNQKKNKNQKTSKSENQKKKKEEKFEKSYYVMKELNENSMYFLENPKKSEGVKKSHERPKILEKLNPMSPEDVKAPGASKAKISKNSEEVKIREDLQKKKNPEFIQSNYIAKGLNEDSGYCIQKDSGFSKASEGFKSRKPAF